MHIGLLGPGLLVIISIPTEVIIVKLGIRFDLLCQAFSLFIGDFTDAFPVEKLEDGCFQGASFTSWFLDWHLGGFLALGAWEISF